MKRKGYTSQEPGLGTVFWSYSAPADELPDQCAYCTGHADALCDYEMPSRKRKDGTVKTCDTPMCYHHAQQVGSAKHDIHYCPEHHVLYTENLKDPSVHLVRLPKRGSCSKSTPPPFVESDLLPLLNPIIRNHYAPTHTLPPHTHTDTEPNVSLPLEEALAYLWEFSNNHIVEAIIPLDANGYPCTEEQVPTTVQLTAEDGRVIMFSFRPWLRHLSHIPFRINPSLLDRKR